ncbi:nucleotide exchange factor GrpE [Ornithinimicrobium pratense]|uniref:Protein GrpE n=1 Tax=Ornithinimicrobium pratense TaxID=2593973 RepID=A0A5J6V2Y5_9MICO|nr:nucleotide exchange factor GrpE [Ornithinimicrobium pratense]QFG67521.1 nucleotide exchange factor GrpE [Ornithinimicrobium pratense]
MSDTDRTPTGGPSEEETAGKGPVIRDKRRIDPETGQPRQAADPQPTVPEDAGAVPGEQSGPGDAGEAGGQDDPHPDAQLAAERLEEMRRMQAEFVNFRNRTQRERETDRTRATGAVVEAMLPLLDDIHSAREHGDLEEGTPFAAIADKLEATLGRFGVERTGFVGEPFDPTVHEALMHLPADGPGVELPEGATEMTVVQVMQPGFKIGDQVVRAARVAVADPS